MVSSLKLASIVGAALVGAAVLCPICETGAVADQANAMASLTAPSDTATATLAIRGMTCGGCATTARLALRRSPGVFKAEVDFDSASAVVLYDPAKTSPERFIAELKRMTGYEASVIPPKAEG